jgi:hypothetical protein
MVLNRIYIAVGLLIIAVLFTALLGPLLIDWTTYRENFEREASRFFGAPVHVAGKANLRILPTPTISFTDVRVGNRAEPALAVERFRAQVELTPLLTGDINVIEMTIDRPVLRIDLADLAKLGGGRAGKDGTMAPAKISLAQVEIVEGQALVSDSRHGRSWSAQAINALVAARSLQGPGRIDGGFVVDGNPVTFRAGIGRRVGEASLPLSVSLTAARWPVNLAVEGTVSLNAGEAAAYEGSYRLAGIAPDEAGDDAGEPDLSGGENTPILASLRSSGAFRLDPDALSLAEFQIGAGPKDRPVQANGEGVVTFGAQPQFKIALSARQIDADRSLGGGPDDPVSIDAALRRFIAGLADLPVPPIGGLLTFDAKGLVVGGSVVQAVGADLSPAADGWDVQIASAVLPGNTRIDLSGKLTVRPQQAFAGTAKLRSRRPSAFAAWLHGGPRAAGRLDEFSVQTRLDLAADMAAFEDITATIGEDAVSGAVRLHTFPQSGDRFVDVDLTARRLDLDKGRSLIDLFAADWLSAGGVTRIGLDLMADTLVAGGVAAQNVVLNGVLADNALALAELSIGDLAGARIAARGRISDPLGDASGRLDASLKAEDLTGAVAFATSLMPDNDLVSRFVRVAPLISPVEAELTVSAGAGDTPMSAGITGTFASTRVSFNATGTGTLADPESLAGRADAVIAGADTARVLSQFGLDIVPLSGTGPARLTMAVEGGLAEGAQVRIDGEGAGLSLAIAGDARLAGEQLSFSGDLGLTGVDIDPALSLAGMAVPGIGAGHALSLNGPVWLEGRTLSLELGEAAFDGDPVTGAIKARIGEEVSVTGSLDLSSASLPVLLSAATGQSLSGPEDLRSKATFAASIPAGLSLNLDISASELDLGVRQIARNAGFRFGFADGGVRIDRLNADFAGGKLRGSAAAMPEDGTMTFRLRAALSGARLEDIAWRAGDRAVAQGGLDFSFAVNGAGRAPAGVVSTLSGSGTFTLADGLVRSVNPHAFSSIIRAADAGLKLDADAVRSVFAGHLDAGTLAFERASGSFAVKSGIIRVSTLSLDTNSATVLGSATIDLNTFQLSSDWSMSVDPGEDKVTGAAPEVGILFEGPLAGPARSIDVTPLLGFLTVRAFEKEVERIEALQAEILEKEFFQRQLKRQRFEAAARERAAQEAAIAAAEAAIRAEAAAKAEAEARAEAEVRAEAVARVEAAEKAEAAAKAAEAAAQAEAAAKAQAEAEAVEAAQAAARAQAAQEAARVEAAAKAEKEAQAAARAEAAAKAAAKSPEPASQNGGQPSLQETGPQEAGAQETGTQETGSEGAAQSDSEALQNLIATDGSSALELGPQPGGPDGALAPSGAEGLHESGAVAPLPELPPLPSISVDDVPVFGARPNLPMVSRPSERLAPAPLPAAPEGDPAPIYKTLPNGIIIRVN